ncbi:hypothetical protein QBC44DRAFT_363476 [Cladorrhinum sp. PSN332]|nr:hypothetical protein QBC44DRAFT_363476 [Cladorrhinum sp. PSN332]
MLYQSPALGAVRHRPEPDDFRVRVRPPLLQLQQSRLAINFNNRTLRITIMASSSEESSPRRGSWSDDSSSQHSQAPVDGVLGEHFQAVLDALAVQANKTTFAVGGLVNFPDGSYTTLRWDTDDPNPPPKVSFPADGANPTSSAAFSKFLQDAEPATFGMGGESVFDESYRKAGKMSADRFCTTFNLSEWGIMETLTHALIHRPHGGIKAELYNVNVYSGPSGKFKPHVDTPRSKDQLGSLVVCLPSPHQGGQLAVRHQGREVIFDWAEKSSITTAVQWAAFFSDCEHEVLQVTSGHRITLTYNLYWTPRISRQPKVIEPEQLAFYPALKNLLSRPDFLPDGGLIGFTCAHAYPHRSKAAGKALRDNLKGIDMLVFQALRHLTGPLGNVRVTDVVNDSRFDYYGVDNEIDKRDAVGDLPLGGPDMFDGQWDDDIPDPAEHGSWSRKEVHWLNHHPNKEKKNREIAIGFIGYGNQPSMEYFYSTAVIVAHFQREPTEEVVQSEEIGGDPVSTEQRADG